MRLHSPAPSAWDEAALLTALQGVGVETLASEVLLGYLTPVSGDGADALCWYEPRPGRTGCIAQGVMRQIELSVIRANRALFRSSCHSLPLIDGCQSAHKGAAAKGAIPEQFTAHWWWPTPMLYCSRVIWVHLGHAYDCAARE